ncbi:MAG: hypothetical protein JSW52_08345 [Candidatus Coatesbacteria bacterium]|nr:MAG: hypothetical protein JSW52_08345 [Candidatus Coatesbacteria bacterium]
MTITLVLAAFVLTSVFTGAEIPARDNLLGPVRTVTTSSGTTLTIDETPATFKVTVPATSGVVPAGGAPAKPAEPAGEETEEGETGEEEAAEPAAGGVGPRLFPSFVEASKAASGTPLLSLDVCGFAYDQFGWGVLTAVDVKLEDGLGVLEAGKQRFLIDLLARVKTIYDNTSGDAHTQAEETMAFLVAGIMLGRADGTLPPEVAVPEEIVDKAEAQKTAFLSQYPQAFYATAPWSWREDLARIMARDRWLSQPLEPGDRDYHSLEKSMVLTEALNSDETLLEQQRFLWDLYSALVGAGHSFTVPEMTGIMAGDDYATVMADPNKRFLEVKRDAIALGVPFRLVPETRSMEYFLVDLLVEDRKKVSFGTFENVVRSVRAAEVTLLPEAGASWRAFEAYALDALIRPGETPESAKISMDDAYKSRLISRLTYAIVQEPGGSGTLGGGGAGGLGPAFTVEPVPSYYLYLARSLSPLDLALPKFLGAVYGELHGFRAGGAVTPTLDGEMGDARELFYGFYLESCYNLGMRPATGGVGDAKAAVERARNFAAGWASDPTFGVDIRRLIPIAPGRTLEGGDGIYCLAVLGVRAVEIAVEYDTPPKVIGGEPTFGPASYTLLVPVIVEVVTPGREVMPHEDYIALCDRYDTPDDLANALEGRAVGAAEEAGEEEGPGSVLDKLDTGTKVLVIVLLVFIIVIIFVLVMKKRQESAI